MANKATRKNSSNKSVDIQSDVIGYLNMSEDDTQRLTTDAYLRLDRFKTGDAHHADRQTLMIRIYAGLYILVDYSYEEAGMTLWMARQYLINYRPQGKKEERKMSVEQHEVLKNALVIIDGLMAEATLWKQVQAYKYGEDKVITDSDKTEYVLLTVH